MKALFSQLVRCLSVATAVGVTLGGFAAAQPKSDDYALSVDTFGAGGGMSSSQSYGSDSVVGGPAGISMAQTTMIKHGHAGQLYDVVDLELFAAPSTVDEKSTRDVHARGILDDDTFLPVPDSEAHWSIDGWPLIAVTPSGVVTAGTVYADTSGTVHAVYGMQSNALTLAVLNVDSDDFQAYAGDGLPDGWQVGYFGEDNPSAGPTIDFEGDGHNNREEYVADTDPTNSESFLHITAVSNASGISVQFQSSGQREYSLLRRDDLTEGTWLPVPGMTNINGVGSLQWLQDTNAAVRSADNYRIRVQLP